MIRKEIRNFGLPNIATVLVTKTWYNENNIQKEARDKESEMKEMSRADIEGKEGEG